MKQLGMLLLGIWLIATGLQTVAGLHFNYDHMVFGVLGIVAGVLILVRR
jgi:hypothetical protein